MARPNLSYLKSLILFLFGLPCGMLTGLTGIGNSVVVVPGVRYLLGLRPARANGTALAVTFFAALAGMLSYAEAGDIRWLQAVVLAVGQIVGAAWGQRLTVLAPRLTQMRPLWSLLVIVAGLAMMYHVLGVSRPGHPLASAYSPPGIPLTGPLFLLWALVVAILVGIISRILLLGGVMLVPGALYLLHFAPAVAQGTALIVLIIASLPGAVIHARRGEAEPQSATWLSAGAVFGGLAGAFYATHLPAPTLRVIFGIALTLLGLMLFSREDPEQGASA